jgi:hypothetical protein
MNNKPSSRYDHLPLLGFPPGGVRQELTLFLLFGCKGKATFPTCKFFLLKKAKKRLKTIFFPIFIQLTDFFYLN